MALLDFSCEKFTEMLASPSPTPGGGGASALVGAIGVALGNMVGQLTVGKKKYAFVEDEVRALMERAEFLRKECLSLIEADKAAFEPLSRAYGIPKDNPDRPEIMEQCLRTAALVPMKILEKCCEAIDLQKEFAEKGSTLAVSDAATGAALCWGAMYGAAVNVKVNTKAMLDRDYAEKINRHVDELMNEYRQKAEKIYEDIYQRYC